MTQGIYATPAADDPTGSACTPPTRLALLSAMLFLQHAVLGAWSPLYPLHLHDLNFSGSQIGAIYAALALSSIFAPWIGGQLADRIVSSSVLMSLCHALGAAFLWMASLSQRFEIILLLMTLHAFVYMPTMAVSNAVVFRNLANPDKEFGLVRLWGTASWIVVAWCMGYWLSRPMWLPESYNPAVVDCLRFAAIIGVILAVFSLTLPPTPPIRAPGLAAFAAIRMLRDRSTTVLMCVCFLLAIGMPYVYPLAGLFLRSLDVPDSAVSPWLSIGQVTEIMAFFSLAFAVRRCGFKTIFLVGIAAWTIRFGIWSAGGPWWMIVFAISLNGCCYAFVFGLGQIFIDRQSASDARASAQSLFQVATFGLGMGLGYWLEGASADFFQRTTADGLIVTDYAQVYFWPTIGSVLCFVLFALLFKMPNAHVVPPTTPLDSRD